MKKYIIFILSGLFLLSSCSEDKLEIGQKGVITEESFYKTDADAESALTAAYQMFITNVGGYSSIVNAPYVLFNLCGDDIYAAGNNYGDNDFLAAINEFRYDTQNSVVNDSYKGYYHAIYGDNLLIDKFKAGTTPIQKRCVAEARVIRAYCHMMLAIGWKNPPLIDHALAGSDKPANSESQKALLDWCAKECEETVSSLDERKSVNDKDGSVKVTKGFAWSVAGKCHLFAGEYNEAKVDLKKVIDSGKYALVPTDRWKELWHVEGDGDEEKIFELNTVENSNIGTWSGKIQRSTWMLPNAWNWRSDKLVTSPTMQGVGGWGGLGVNEKFAQDFENNDGDSPRRKASIISYKEFMTDLAYPDDADKTMTEDEKLADPNRGINSPEGLYGQCLYLPLKRIYTKADVYPNSYSVNNYLIMRYAEVLLMYAEACAQTNDPSGLQYLNAIQERAGSKHISSTLTLDEVKNEKKYEMWLEDCRWPDMVRWGDLDGIKNAGKNIPSLHDEFIAPDKPNYKKKHVGYLTYSNPNEGKAFGFVKGKHEYFPIPYSETSTNPNIKQNPGWGTASSTNPASK